MEPLLFVERELSKYRMSGNEILDSLFQEKKLIRSTENGRYEPIVPMYLYVPPENSSNITGGIIDYAAETVKGKGKWVIYFRQLGEPKRKEPLAGDEHAMALNHDRWNVYKGSGSFRVLKIGMGMLPGTQPGIVLCTDGVFVSASHEDARLDLTYLHSSARHVI